MDWAEAVLRFEPAPIGLDPVGLQSRPVEPTGNRGDPSVVVREDAAEVRVNATVPRVPTSANARSARQVPRASLTAYSPRP